MDATQITRNSQRMRHQATVIRTVFTVVFYSVTKKRKKRLQHSNRKHKLRYSNESNQRYTRALLFLQLQRTGLTKLYQNLLWKTASASNPLYRVKSKHLLSKGTQRIGVKWAATQESQPRVQMVLRSMCMCNSRWLVSNQYRLLQTDWCLNLLVGKRYGLLLTQLPALRTTYTCRSWIPRRLQ